MVEETYNEPSNVSAESGDVHMKGPDGVDVLLTPEAALETSDRLLEGGAHAQGQRREAERDRKDRHDRHN